MTDDERRADWQRRYDESLVRERARGADDDVSVPEAAALEGAGCASTGFLPGWLGAIALAATAIVVVVSRKLRNT